jgi:LysR family transcriptional regulator, transcriptional activator of the cysJI operon
MNLRRLKIFLAVCECMNMTRAAEALYMTQPSVSQAISELERELGIRLFERLSHRLYLTEAGRRLQSYARHILNLVEQAHQEITELSHGGRLRVGASLTIGTHLLPQMAACYRTLHPEVELVTLVDNTSVIEALILEDRLDLGLVEGRLNSSDILEKFIQNDDLIIIGAPNHPLIQRSSIQARDLAGEGFIVREDGSGTRELFQSAMRDADIPWRIAGVYNNIEAIKQAARQNLGLGVVPEISIEQELLAGMLIPIRISGLKLTRKFNLIYHRQKYFTKAMLAFADLFGDFHDKPI